jgi:type III pantothenate kinase
LLELGHSRLKSACVGAGGDLVDVERLDVGRFARWLADVEVAPSTRFWLAAVPAAAAVAPVTDALRRRGAAWTRIATGQPPLDVAPAYPGLGVDRWLALQAARRRVDGAFCLVDAGTATTIDVVDAAGRHLGGWILPGREAAREGLLARAPVLRRDVPAIDTLAPATETGRAIERGLLLQQVGAVERALAEARALPGLAEPALVMTGGDAASLQSRVHGARVEPDLVLEGLAMAAQRANGA